MDVDSDPVQRQPDFITYFEASPNLFPWREPRPQQIERRRASLNDLLIFDILLSSGGIRQPDTLYPPSDIPSLQRLLDAIETSQYDTLKKECLVYFLLKWHQDGRESSFQYERCIPPQFAALADAYWYLDTGINVPRAVSILSDARLNKDYVSKIIHALSLAPNPTPLILKYVRTAKPLLTEPVDIDVYTTALAESSLVEAWQFQRTFNEKDETRSRLVRKILEWCVSPKARPGPLTQLLALPFTPYEQSLLHAYALKPPESLPISALAIIQDLICVRLIQGGKYADAIKMDQQFSSAATHSKIQTHAQTLERKKMMQELYAALPLAERTLLDTELELFAQGTNMSASSSNTTTLSGSMSGDVNLSQSWEHFSAPQPAINGKAPSMAPTFRDIHTPVLPISERSGGPRFGGPLFNNSALGGSAPRANSTSTPGPVQAPILPVSMQTPLLNGNGSGSNARRSFPLPGFSPTNSTSRPRQSLSHTPTDFLMGAGVGSSSTGLRFPQAPQLPISLTSSAFNSAGRKPNAFYQPPPAKANGVKRAFGDEEATGSGSVSPERALPPVRDMDVVMEMTDSDHEGRGDNDGSAGEEGVAELEFSVFGNGGRRNVSAGRRVRGTRRGEKGKGGRKVPPGAFLSDEEEDGDVVDMWRRASPPQPQARQTRARSSATNKTTTKSKTNTRVVKERDLGRSLPGSLMDEDHEGHEEEEEDDYVAPLRAPSPPIASKRPMRKVRTSSSDVGDEGVQTRRRSSRLTASSAPTVSPDPSVVGAGAGTSKPRKGTRAGGGRKKR